MEHLSDNLRQLDREMWEIFASLEELDDTTAVIRAAAFIDHALRFLLESDLARTKLVALPRPPERIPTHFAERAALARRLSLISEADFAEITLIRRLRNKFAHGYKDARLCQPDFAGLTMQLSAWSFWTSSDHQHARSNDPSESKARLLVSAAVIAKDIVSPLGATRTMSVDECRRFWMEVFRYEAEESTAP